MCPLPAAGSVAQLSTAVLQPCVWCAFLRGCRLRRAAGLQLERNEVIALFNTLERLAAGVEVVRDLSLQLR